MQTYTHLTVGLAVGTVLFPDNYLVQVIFMAGSILPDVSSVIKMITDKVRGKKPFADLEKCPLANNIFHSFFVWAGIIPACVVIRYLHVPSLSMIPFFALGGLLHCCSRHTHLAD